MVFLAADRAALSLPPIILRLALYRWRFRLAAMRKQQSRRGLTDGFANVPKTVPRFTRHRQGCRTGNEGFQSSHQPDNESIAQARSPSSRFFEQGVRFRNHESRSIRREGSRQISRSCRTCCVRVDARAIVPRPINVMRRQISQKGLPLWGNISISC